MHGNEQIINELLGKYVHRLNKSTRQQFLVNLAARRCDDDSSDSDSEGSSVVDEFGDIVNITSSSSSAEQVKVIPQPPRCVALVAPSDDASPEPSHLLQHRPPHKGSKVDPVSKTAKEQQLVNAVIPRVNSSPLLRRAESFRRKAPAAKEGIEARQHEANLSSISSDTISRRPVHQLPTRSALDLKPSKSLSMRSSVYSEADDDISVAASVMSTASIQSALYSTPSTSTDSQLNVGSNHCYKTQSRRENPPRLPMRGSYVHTSSTKSKKFDMDDTSTVTTEATSMYGSISLSRSMSFESATSFEVIQEVKSKSVESVMSSSSKLSLPKSSRRSELDRLKKLTHIRPMSSDSNGSNQKKSLNNIMLTQIDRTEPVMEEKESKPVVPTKSSLKDLKSNRYGLGRVSGSKDAVSVASDRSDSIATASVVSRTSSTCSTVEIEKRSMTAVSKRALLRRHSSTARARSATRTTSIAEDIGKLTQVQVVDNANTSQPVVARARPQSISPLRTASTRVGSSMVDRKDITNRLSNHCIVHKKSEEEKGDVTTSVSMPSVPIETKSSSTMSSRAERRRSRSVSRSRVPQSSAQSSRSNSTLRTTPAPTTLRSDPHMGTPPRSAPKILVNKTSIHMATPPKILSRTAAPDEIVARSNSPSPMRTSLMKSALIKKCC